MAISYRPISEDDHNFLRQVYASTREEELKLTGWNEEQKNEFLRMQFTAQHQYYQENYGDASFDIILMGDTQIGRLYVDRGEEEIRIIDIALLPECRGRGIGGKIMQELLDEARQQNKPVRIHVEQNNPAMHLYDRLGFKKLDDVGVYYFMEWSAEGGKAE